MRWLGVVVLVVVGGCTKPNPRSCADGLCTDQAFPFCDVEGVLGGTPNECIAVVCEPGEFAACRGNLAVNCNDTGNDFNLVECPLGCNNATGCLACSTDAQCANPTPICEEGTSCRGCIEDDECASRVCDNGSCAAESGIVYAANDGSSASDCSLAVPCSVARAIQLAKAAFPQPTIRMLPGVYVVGLSFSGATTAPIEIVASGATIADVTALNVQAGAAVRIRGPELVGTSFALSCGEANTSPSKVTVLDAKLIAGNDSANVVGGAECEISISSSKLAVNDGGAISIATGARFVGDRLHIAGTQTFIFMFSNQVDLVLTNSLIEDPVFNFASGSGSSAILSFNTIVLTSSPIPCSLNPGMTARIENSIVAAKGALGASVIDGTDCVLEDNILHPQQVVPATNLDVDPLFIDVAMGDFRVQPTSAAVDAAGMPIFPTDHDFSGATRPQGAGPDIGAFEQ
jgi:hypothetical protein